MGGVGWGRVAVRAGVLVAGVAVVWTVLGWLVGMSGFLGQVFAMAAAGALCGAGWLLARWGPVWAAIAGCVLAGLPLLALAYAAVPANTYLRAAGKPTEVVIVKVEHVSTKRGGYDVYRLAGLDGKAIDGDLEGAANGLEPGTRMSVAVDPLGVVAPRLQAETEDRSLEAASLIAFAAWTLFAVLGTVLGEVAARRGTPLEAGLRRLVPDSPWARAGLITLGLAAAAVAEGWTIAAFPEFAAWAVGVPLGAAAVAAPFLLARATNVRVNGQQAWWPAWTGLCFAAALFIGGCVIPKDAYLSAFGERTTGVVADAVCEQSGSGCYYQYTLNDREGRPLNGTLGDSRLYDPGTELHVLADPRRNVAPQLVTDDRAAVGYRMAAVGLLGFAATAAAACLKNRAQQRAAAREAARPTRRRSPQLQGKRKRP